MTHALKVVTQNDRDFMDVILPQLNKQIISEICTARSLFMKRFYSENSGARFWTGM